jgi:hypothetical protein
MSANENQSASNVKQADNAMSMPMLIMLFFVVSLGLMCAINSCGGGTRAQDENSFDETYDGL